MVYYIDNELMIRNMEEADARIFTDEEIKQGWHTDISKFLTRLKDQSGGKCISLTAAYKGVPAGYVNIYISPSGGPFGGKGLPEIVDFGVLEKYRRRGIGSKLMDAAEQLAGQYADTVWLGVGLHSGYGSAQRMYVKRGYIPDGTGVWYRDKACAQYETEIANDDDLVLFLSRNLCRRPAGAELRTQHPGIEPTKISLCRPGRRYSGQVMDFRDELKQNGDEFDGCAGLEDCASFEEWIQFGDRLRVKYKEGYVPSEVFLAVRETDDRLVGIIDYRHPLTDFLMNFGGNIGYSIRPSERRKGYASEMLRLMLDLCRFYGEKRVLLTFAGMFVETTVVALLMTPILLPVVQSVGVDPVHFGVLMMTVVTGGIMTPPVGIALYTTSEIMECKPQETAREAVPFYIVMLTVILIIAFIPQATMFLPNLVYR